MTVYNVISSNKRKTILIMIFFVLFFFTVAYIFGKALGYENTFAVTMLVISTTIALLSYFFSDKTVLALTHAKQINHDESKELYHIVENLTIAAGLPMPKIYIIDDPAPNAFATGRDPKHASIAVTKGLIEKLKTAEMEGVIAHELSHIKNFDTRLMTIVVILVGSLAILSDIFLRTVWHGSGKSNKKGNTIIFLIAMILAVLAPLVGTLMQLAISRKREYLADADGVLLTRYPEGLANALEKIASDTNVLQNANNATANLFIENPFKNTKTNWLNSLFNTHPPVEERIKILRSM